MNLGQPMCLNVQILVAFTKGGYLRSPKRKIELVRKRRKANALTTQSAPWSRTSGNGPTVTWGAPDRDPTTMYGLQVLDPDSNIINADDDTQNQLYQPPYCASLSFGRTTFRDTRLPQFTSFKQTTMI